MKTTEGYTFLRNFCKSNGIPVAHTYTQKAGRSWSVDTGKRYCALAFRNLTGEQVKLLDELCYSETDYRFSKARFYSSFGHYVRFTAEKV